MTSQQSPFCLNIIPTSSDSFFENLERFCTLCAAWSKCSYTSTPGNTNWCCALTLQWSSTTMWFNLLLKCCLRPTNNGLISSNKVVLVSHQLILWCLSSSTMNRFWNSITNLSFLSLLALIYLLIIKVCSHEMVAVMETRFFTSVSLLRANVSKNRR